MWLLSWLRLALALPLLGLALLAVLRIPHGALWKPAVAATEWGHALAPIALLPLLGPWSDISSRAAIPASLLASALLLTPVLRARAAASSLPERFEAAFGPTRAIPGGRSAPLVLRDLWRSLSDGPAPRTLSFPAADGSPRSVDLYLPPGPGPHPLLVTVHGGSWNSGDRTVLAGLNRYLAARGQAVAAIEYRLAPSHRFPAQRDDVLAAVAWLKEVAPTFGLDPGRIVLHGRSAGAHLALSAACSAGDPAIRGVIALYPPTDLRWSWDHPGSSWIIDTPGTLRGLLGGTPSEVGPLYDEASPIRSVGPDSPPTLLIHGGRDELVFPEQSRRLEQALASAGAPHLLVELPWATHGLDANLSGPGGQISTWLVERFLAVTSTTASGSRPATARSTQGTHSSGRSSGGAASKPTEVEGRGRCARRSRSSRRPCARCHRRTLRVRGGCAVDARRRADRPADHRTSSADVAPGGRDPLKFTDGRSPDE